MKKFMNYMPACCAVMLALLLGACFSTQSLKAQSAYGSLVGTVTDTSGSAVPDANVTLTNLGTNEKKVVQTDASGNYRFVNLLPTQYKLEIEKTSYKRSVRTPVTVLVDSAGRLDVSLEVGAVSETVEVTTQAPLLQTESGTLGSQVEGKTVQEMPLNGRNVTNLISLVPGVVPQGASMGNTTMNQGTHTNNAGWGNFQIGGAISGYGTMYIDGAPLNGMYGNFVGYVPTQDFIQEFKVGTNSVSAEYGRFGGGVVEMTTKSGTNQFHGSAYEFLRNTVLNASNANIVGGQLKTPTTKSKWLQNQYGFAVGGPVIRDKAFFFFSWEKFSSRTSSQRVTNVPDAQMMADANPSILGDATTYLDKTTNTRKPVVLPASQAGCLTYDGSRTTIATSCIDPTSKLIKGYFAAPTSSVAVGSNNYSYFVPLGDDNSQYNARGDINLSDKQRLFVRYSYLKTDDMSADNMASANGWKTGGAISVYPTHQAILGDTITINPTTIADVRASYLRQYFNDMPPSVPTDLASKGFNGNWQAINKAQALPQLPDLYVKGSYNLWTFGGMGIVQERWQNTYALSGSLTKILGAHTLKVGGEGRLYDYEALPQFYPGYLNVDNTNYSKNEWVNFLLGDLNNFQYQQPLRTTSFNWYQGYYGTDTWNATRKLTVTAGLRWELPGAYAEKKDRSTVALPDADQVVNGTNAHGILALVSTSQYSSRWNEPIKHNLFSPRLGVAYRVSDDTVVRAGYALTYLPSNLALGMEPAYSPINLAPTYNYNTSDTTNYYTVNNPLGTGTAGAVSIVQPDGRNNPNFLSKYANVIVAGMPTGTVMATVPTSKFSYMQQWNFTVGQQFKGAQSLELGYAGAIGIHLPAVGQAGWGLDQLSSANAAVLASDMAAAGTNSALVLAANQKAQAARPRPAYKNYVDANPLNGTMTYHALQAKYTKRFGSGLLSSGYTFGKSIGDTDTLSPFLDGTTIGLIQNYNNIKEERSVLSYSIAQRWVTSYVLDLPFGKGKMWANNLNGTMNRVVSGWSVNGITTLQTGRPLALLQNNNTLATQFGGGQTRPNVTAGCAKATSGSAQQRLAKWFDTSCYSTVGAYAMGNEPRVEPRLQAPGIANWDFTAQKTTPITEGTNLAFRVEFFNIFNRRQFAIPTMNISSGSSFGTITTQANNPRQIQGSMRFNF
jgi:hypothetical protein